MKKILPILIVILTLTQNVSSQEKVILGDTTIYYSWSKSLAKKLKLQDFTTTQDEFSFRYWNHGQVVEISKNNDSITGELTNYIFRLNHRTQNTQDTIFNKLLLDKVIVDATIKLINTSGILSLQTDEKIENWHKGYDGITYIIEHSDKSTYWFKNYWTPSSQDSIPESLTVLNFVKCLSDTLALTEKYELFKNSLPRKDCYNSGGMTVMCYINNSFGLGYYGSTKLPFGYLASLRLAYVGRLQTNFGLSIQHQFDQDQNSDFELTLQKGYLFLNESNKILDFVAYQYRSRKLDSSEPKIPITNHQIYYGLAFKKNLDIALGIDYQLGENNRIGGIIYASKWMPRPKINILGKTSIFENQIDYRFGISKSITFNNKFPISSASIGFYFENFKAYSDLNLSITIWI